jgi:hypothetical protein
VLVHRASAQLALHLGFGGLEVKHLLGQRNVASCILHHERFLLLISAYVSISIQPAAFFLRTVSYLQTKRKSLVHGTIEQLVVMRFYCILYWQHVQRTRDI